MWHKFQTLLKSPGRAGILVRALLGSAGLRIVGMGFGFLVGVQLARGLGAEGYGIYGLAMSIIALLTVPTEFGLPQLLTREVAVAHSQNNFARIQGMLKWATQACLLLSAIVAVGLLGWLIWHKQVVTPLGNTLLAGVVMIPLVALLSLRSAALRGVQKIVIGQISEVALRPALHSLLLFLVPIFLFSLSPAIAMVLGVMAAGIALIYAQYQLRQNLPTAMPIDNVQVDSRGWWRSAVPMALTEGMRLLQSHVLIFFLGWMVVMPEVGIFRMAVSVAAMLAMPISLFTIVCMPIIARLHAMGHKAQLQSMLTLVSAGMLTGILLLSLPFFVAGGWLLGIVFGDEFASGNASLLLLSIAGMLSAVFGMNAALLNMTGNQQRVTRASGVALLVLLAASQPLIQSYGILGAAISNILSVAVWNVLMWHDCRRLLGLDTGIWHISNLIKGK